MDPRFRITTMTLSLTILPTWTTTYSIPEKTSSLPWVEPSISSCSSSKTLRWNHLTCLWRSESMTSRGKLKCGLWKVCPTLRACPNLRTYTQTQQTAWPHLNKRCNLKLITSSFCSLRIGCTRVLKERCPSPDTLTTLYLREKRPVFLGDLALLSGLVKAQLFVKLWTANNLLWGSPMKPLIHTLIVAKLTPKTSLERWCWATMENLFPLMLVTPSLVALTLNRRSQQRSGEAAVTSMWICAMTCLKFQATTFSLQTKSVWNNNTKIP